MTFVNSTKLQAMVLAWENFQEVFVMLVVVVVFYVNWAFYVSGLLFHATGTTPWLLRPVKASTSSTLATFGWFTFARLFRHSFTTSATVLNGHFLHSGVFYLALFHHIFSTFCDSNAGRNTPSRILLCACPHRVVFSGWCMELNY